MARLIVDPLAPQSAGPDTVWDGERGDMAVAPLSEPGNPGGLLARNPLLTAIVLALETDARGERDPLDPYAYDVRGWPGDGFDIDRSRGEAPLGSTTWTAWRYAVDDENAQRVIDSTRVALQPLQNQGAIGEVDVTAEPDPASNLIRRLIHIRRPDGTVLYSGPYAGLWDAIRAG